jgi:hypothetical protein
MCPYLLELKTQTVCSCHPEGAFCPSEELMKKSCLGNFKDCSYFKAKHPLESLKRRQIILLAIKNKRPKGEI